MTTRMLATRSVFLSILLFSILPHVLLAQAPTAKAPAPAPSNQDDSYAKEPYVIELVQQNIRFESDGRGQRELTIRVRIQSESAVREFGLLVYPFASSFESLDVVYARVREPDGTVTETPPSDIQELDSAVSREAPMYTDQREKHIAIKSLSVGDVLEARFRWTVHDPIAPGHFWYDSTYFRAGICLKELVELNLPRATPVKLHYTDPQPTIKEEGDRRIYTFQTANLKKPEESKTPEWEKNFHGADPAELRFSSFSSWEDVGTWFNALEQPKIVVTPEIRAKAEEVTKGKTTEDEKIHALYDFVSTHLRYIGVDLGLGRYAPHAAADVLANRYGDCKDKHTLFAAVLQAVGIPAYPALISSRYRVDSALPSPSLFDHVITAIPQGDKILFLDTTPEVAPYGLLLQNLRDRQALVIPPNIAAKLVLTPADPPFRGFETFRIDSSIDVHGTLDAKMRLDERGDGEILLRSAYRATPQNRWDELTQKLLNSMGFAGTVSEVSLIQPEDTSQPFWLALTYHRTDFPDWKNHRISLPAPFFFLRELTEEQKLSKDPLPFGSPQDVTYETSIKLPKDYGAILPENVARKLDFAEFTADYSIDKAGVLHGAFRLKTLLPEVPGEKRKEFSGLAKSIEETTRRYIFISGDSPASENAPPILRRMKPDKPEEMILRLEQDLAGHPDHRTSLLMLNEAYIKAGRSKDAAALLEKTLATSPDNPDQLYYALGHAYLGIPDVDRAIAQFQKALGDKPEPPVLNSVAYSLADANVHLSDALDYSNRAVTAVSAKTMEISSDDAETSDFGLMTELAADWDTLGWVKFRQGDIAPAEKYTLSAWQLMQVPAIGEHLVEIYEKLGKKREAARICAMAQATPGGSADKTLSDHMVRLRPFLTTSGAPSSRLFSPDAQGALSDMRTINVPYRAKFEGNSLLAHFVISMTSGAKVDNVVFVSGSEELRNAIAALAATKYPQSFPDDTPVRIIRKGTFSCSKYTRQCVLVLIPVFDAALPAN